MAGASIESLPAELISNIFELVCSQHSSTIQNCRLVSRTFCDLSSPFLITTIVIAERLDALQWTKKIINHPYFSRHVTHLIWDASEFEKRLVHHENDGVTTASKLLGHTTASLGHLTIATGLDNGYYADFALNPSRSLPKILSPLKFERLHTLELRRWNFALLDIEDFLFSHADTIRYLHLLDCRCDDDYYEVLDKVSQDWPERLKLEGAEVVGLLFVRNQITAEITHDCELSPTLTAVQVLDYFNEDNDVDYEEQDRKHSIGFCPKNGATFEKAMLGGRKNDVVRRLPRFHPSSTVEWYKTPVYFTHSQTTKNYV